MTDKITVQIELDVALLHESAKAAFARLMCPPQHHHSDGGEGHKILARAVLDHLAGMDFGAIITEALARRMAPVADEVVDAALRAAVKKKVRVLEAAGQLPLQP